MVKSCTCCCHFSIFLGRPRTSKLPTSHLDCALKLGGMVRASRGCRDMYMHVLMCMCMCSCVHACGHHVHACGHTPVKLKIAPWCLLTSSLTGCWKDTEGLGCAKHGRLVSGTFSSSPPACQHLLTDSKWILINNTYINNTLGAHQQHHSLMYLILLPADQQPL